MTSVILKTIYTQQIETDTELQGVIAKAAKRSNPTVLRWAQDNHDMLCHIAVLKAISKYKNIPVDELYGDYAEDISEKEQLAEQNS